MDRARLVVQRMGDAWVFGRDGTVFESFPTLELAVARANEFAKRHPDTEVVVVDEDGGDRRTRG